MKIGKMKNYFIFGFKTVKNNRIVIMSSSSFGFTSSTSSSNSINDIISNELMKLYEHRKLTGSEFSARAYKKAADIVNTWPELIESGNQLSNVKGVGKKIIDVINKIISDQPNKDESKNDKSKEESTSVNDNTEEDLKIMSLKEFTSIHGVGPKRANKWWDLGYRTLDDIPIEICTKSQKVAMKHRDELNKKIPRAEIEHFELILRKWLDVLDNQNEFTVMKMTICGSYRRGKVESGDIDILLSVDDNDDEETKKNLRDYILTCPNNIEDISFEYPHNMRHISNNEMFTDILACGMKKTLAVGKLNKGIHRRIDIQIVELSKYPYAILYFTGSKEHNIKMRNAALNRGWTLNEYRMLDDNDREIPAKTERDIFDLLELKYLEPSERI